MSITNTTNPAQPYEHFDHWERIRKHDPKHGQRIRAGHTHVISRSRSWEATSKQHRSVA